MQSVHTLHSPLLGALCTGMLALAGVTAEAAVVPGQGTWETTLQGRDLDGDRTTAEAYYDTTLDITWLADANHARTSGYDADGRMTWTVATDWAANLDPYGSGIGGWRLPALADTATPGCNYAVTGGTDCGYNVDTDNSEMAHLYYITLGNLAYYAPSGSSNQPGWGLGNTGPFTNLEGLFFWTGTPYLPVAGATWGFSFHDGLQHYGYQVSSNGAWAVHGGDVGAALAAVPLPAAAWLFGAGLLGLTGVARRRMV